ncbi:hypothetical protein EJC49_05625 [Aquibium carbonis]|uniref:Uncharacterized protein n=1 Tax=Aquibium carbonis TaxID=2495581 RepID=A0A429Z114_9HYPH|nr:hypothetical protein [Aquibium carbonis]RST87401.1 hypothetical protein EJC49_05625 [Aquibium carbonis]
MKLAKIAGIAVACGALLLGDVVGSLELGGIKTTGLFVGEAHARIGRPATPRSAAGVARRTTRRVVRRSTIYVVALPGGCVVTPINGINYWRCGPTYYQATGGRYVVVYID